MEITGNQIIAAPRQCVWDALNNPDILKRSLPGCESVERVSDDEFKVIMAAAIGPLRAKFNGTLKMSDAHAPESCTMVFEGQGGAVGFGKGHSSVKLTEVNGQTELSYSAQAQVGGKLAQVGSRLIDSVARKMADDFFKAFKTQLAGNTSDDQASKTVKPFKAAQARRTDVDEKSAPHKSMSESSQIDVTTSMQIMVPGWWLFVAALIGSGTTLAGLVFAH